MVPPQTLPLPPFLAKSEHVDDDHISNEFFEGSTPEKNNWFQEPCVGEPGGYFLMASLDLILKFKQFNVTLLLLMFKYE